MVVKWQFSDGTTTAVFPINPDTGGTPELHRMVASQHVPQDGKTLVFMNCDKQGDIGFSGSITTQVGYDLMTTWFSKTNPITLTDDLGRIYTIVITEFTPKRVRSSTVPYYHTYSVKAVVVG